MLTKRIIPCLDVDRGRVVKGVKFFDHVDAGDPVEQARRYQDQGADELVFYDITASHEGRQIMADLVPRGRAGLYATDVGGGIRTLDDATCYPAGRKGEPQLRAVKNPKLIAEIRTIRPAPPCWASTPTRQERRQRRAERWNVHHLWPHSPGIDVMAWCRRRVWACESCNVRKLDGRAPDDWK